MGKTLERLVSAAVGLSFFSLLFCTPYNPIMARRDYLQYPKAQKEIAYYNITNILQKICGGGATVTPEKFTCILTHCASWYRSSGGHVSCLREEKENLTMEWKDVKRIEVKGISFQINGKHVFSQYYPETLADLAEAMKIYAGLKRIE